MLLLQQLTRRYFPISAINQFASKNEIFPQSPLLKKVLVRTKIHFHNIEKNQGYCLKQCNDSYSTLVLFLCCKIGRTYGHQAMVTCRDKKTLEKLTQDCNIYETLYLNCLATLDRNTIHPRLTYSWLHLFIPSIL